MAHTKEMLTVHINPDQSIPYKDRTALLKATSPVDDAVHYRILNRADAVRIIDAVEEVCDPTLRPFIRIYGDETKGGHLLLEDPDGIKPAVKVALTPPMIKSFLHLVLKAGLSGIARELAHATEAASAQQQGKA